MNLPMLPQIIFIHGNNSGKEPGGKGSDFWFPWARAQFEQAGLQATAPDFPDPMLARADVWLPYLERECGADENSILIGHSSGAIAAMRYAEQRQILGSVLVGAYYTDTGDECERRSGYFDAPWDWEAISAHQHWIMQFASKDDPYFSYDEPLVVRDNLRTEYHEFDKRGHFFDSTFPELVEAVLQKINMQ